MEPMPEASRRPLTINPFRISQALGGVLALQGIYRSMPILHGAQGCVESIKTVISRHFLEPVSIQNIAMHEYNLIFGGAESIREVLYMVMSRHKPDVVGLIGTSLTEVVGENLQEAVRSYHENGTHPQQNTMLFSLYLPDYEGSMESGYARTAYAVLKGIIRMPDVHSRKKRRNQINLLAGSHLTPGDVMELKEIIASFGLDVIVLPDLSSSLTGHLLTGHTSLSRGGVPVDYLKEAVNSGFTLAVGHSMESAAALLKDEFQIPYAVFPGVMGLEATDDLFAFLQQYSLNEVQVKYRWQRQFLLDCMLDTRFAFRGKRIVAALEPDHLVVVHRWLSELGIQSFRYVAPVASPALDSISELGYPGDLEQLEQLCGGGADLWISNSHGEQVANRHAIPFIPQGFPVFNRFGSPFTVNVGYKGTADQINYYANVLMNNGGAYR